ncbi:MAG TPA: hypothetical protein VG275_07200 [Solirubrobacteraceae bacterium]|nr:hypothetical protein [Solirubrobacteraceae bacterium]
MTEFERNGSRSSGAVLTAALSELRERERKLCAFEGELAEVRKAIKVLERATGEPADRTDQAPRGETKRAVLAALTAAGEPMTRDEIAAAIGREPGGWLKSVLGRMTRAGEIAQFAAGRYGPKTSAEVDEDAEERPLDESILDAAGIETA